MVNERNEFYYIFEAHIVIVFAVIIIVCTVYENLSHEKLVTDLNVDGTCVYVF